MHYIVNALACIGACTVAFAVYVGVELIREWLEL